MTIPPKRFAQSRGFTLVEMLTVVVIVGLIMLLIGYELDSTISGYFHDRNNMDTQTESRLVMTKVVNRLRGASPWEFFSAPSPSASGGPHQVILIPAPGPSPAPTATSLQFYRPHPGSLSLATAIPTSPAGAPDPPYDIVTIQRATCPFVGCKDPSPNYLVETAVDASTDLPSEQPVVLGSNVTDFTVSAQGNVSPALVTVSITVQNTAPGCHPAVPPPSPPPFCNYTAQDTVWVGGGDDPSTNE
jgi:prepilin-type N-terminal cleavage/methylation domain-containing protein